MSTSIEALSHRIKLIEDRNEICDRLAIWCRSVDVRDFDLLWQVFDKDVTWDFGKGAVDNGLGHVIERIRAHIVEATYCGERQIHLANVQVEVDGDRATSEAYFFSTSAGTRGFENQALLEWGAYKDIWRRGQGGWRIVHRLYRMKIQQGPLGIVYGSAPAEMWQEGDARRMDR
jgi:SnoaL-like domain